MVVSWVRMRMRVRVLVRAWLIRLQLSTAPSLTAVSGVDVSLEGAGTTSAAEGRGVDGVQGRDWPAAGAKMRGAQGRPIAASLRQREPISTGSNSGGVARVTGSAPSRGPSEPPVADLYAAQHAAGVTLDASGALPWVSDPSFSDPLVREYQERHSADQKRINTLVREAAEFLPRVEEIVSENDTLRAEVARLTSLTLHAVRDGSVVVSVGGPSGAPMGVGGSALVARVSSLEEELEAYKAEAEALSSERDLLQQDIDRKTDTILQYREFWVEVKRKHAVVVDERDAHARAVDDLEEVVQSLRLHNSELAERVHRLESQSVRLQDVEGESHTMKVALREITAQRDGLLRDAASYAGRDEQLQQTLQQLERDLMDATGALRVGEETRRMSEAREQEAVKGLRQMEVHLTEREQKDQEAHDRVNDTLNLMETLRTQKVGLEREVSLVRDQLVEMTERFELVRVNVEREIQNAVDKSHHELREKQSRLADQLQDALRKETKAAGELDSKVADLAAVVGEVTALREQLQHREEEHATECGRFGERVAALEQDRHRLEEAVSERNSEMEQVVRSKQEQQAADVERLAGLIRQKAMVHQELGTLGTIVVWWVDGGGEEYLVSML